MKKQIFYCAIGLISLATGCSGGPPKPAATKVQWTVQRLPDGTGYKLTGSAEFQRGPTGWYQPTLTLIDERGCRNVAEIRETQMVDSSATGTVPVTFDYTAKVKQRVATADFNIQFNDLPSGSSNPRDITRTGVFADTAVIDASIQPPEMPENACNKSPAELAAGRKARLRKQAESDPDGADAAAIDGMSRNEVLATAINSAGFLCAKVSDTYPSAGNIVVHCVEYRSGRGRSKYKIDTASMRVIKLD